MEQPRVHGFAWLCKFVFKTGNMKFYCRGSQYTSLMFFAVSVDVLKDLVSAEVVT
jgi:hypothetical protein